MPCADIKLLASYPFRLFFIILFVYITVLSYRHGIRWAPPLTSSYNPDWFSSALKDPISPWTHRPPHAVYIFEPHNLDPGLSFA